MFYAETLKMSDGECMRNIMRQSSLMFYPTGSRYFETATESSDWDYFVQDSPETNKFLEKYGFELESESYKADPVIVAVYKLYDIHIQVVKNAVAKQRIQWDLLPVFAKLKPNKELAKFLWSWATKLYWDGMDGWKMKNNPPF